MKFTVHTVEEWESIMPFVVMMQETGLQYKVCSSHPIGMVAADCYMPHFIRLPMDWVFRM
ncbi:hypothetical protein [Ammoniphilus sp. 3BR4]|uniref:hypothetical protein n=1 Tax=Ammoniphilus sp. 3BR4 TaxID=3158265 RepID=UPI003465C6BF